MMKFSLPLREIALTALLSSLFGTAFAADDTIKVGVLHFALRHHGH
jgi:hypothetical protein